MEIYHSENCCCNGKDYFLFVSTTADDKVIVNFISIDFKCVRAKYDFEVANNNVAENHKFIKDKIKVTGTEKFKAAIFDLFGMKSSKKRYEFCKYWEAYCNYHKITYQFINSATLVITSILHGSNIDITGNSITLVHITKIQITVYYLETCYNGGFFIKKETTLNLDCSDKVLKDTVMKGKNSSKIILSMDDPLNKRKFQSILKSPKLFVLTKNYSNYILKALEAMVNDLTDICKNEFNIYPYSENDLFIIKQQKSDRCYGSFEMKCLKNTRLPFSKIVDTFVDENENFVLSIWNGKCLETIETCDLSQFASTRIQLTLSIDSNGYVKIDIEKQNNITFCSFRQRQQDAFINFDNEDGDGKISITIPDIGKLKDDDGNATISPYISFFDNGMPVIGEAAQKLAAQHPSFVVYDIFALTKMAVTSTIKTDPKWGFKVDKDSSGTLQVIFNTWRGTRKATPEFLLAILINHLLKIAKDRLGFVPKVVDIMVGDNFRYLENGIIAALKRLNEKSEIQSDRSKRIIKVDDPHVKVTFSFSNNEFKMSAQRRMGKITVD